MNVSFKYVVSIFPIVSLVLIGCNAGPIPDPDPPSPSDVFNIVWKDYDGAELLNETYRYGEIPTYKRELPKRDPSEGYSYLFNSWLPEVTPVIESKVYTATYDKYHSNPSVIINFSVPAKGADINFECDGEVEMVDWNGMLSHKLSEYFYQEGDYYCKIHGDINSFRLLHGKDCVTNIQISCPCVDERVFSNCENLISVTLNDGVILIGDRAFEYCEKLEEVIISDSVTSIGEYAFLGCDSLHYNTLDSGLYLGNESNQYLFLCETDNKDFESFTINENCKFIDSSVFSSCKNLKSITIPENVISIGGWSFHECTNLESAFISDSVISLGELAFRDCKKLSTVKLSSRITRIESCTFHTCQSLSSITIPDGVTYIGSYAFFKSGLRYRLTIPDSVASIEESAFQSCWYLPNIFIPNSVSFIGKNAFKDCSALTISCEANSEPESWDNNWNPDNCNVVWGSKPN